MLEQVRVQPIEHTAKRRDMNLLESFARSGLEAADNFFASLGSRQQRGPGSLIVVLFHSLYRNKSQFADTALAPNQNVTTDDFRRFVEAVLESGYTVVSPSQVDAGLNPGGRYVMITFDDGYFNNTLALDILDQFQVPAAFFVSSDHVLQNKAFWWDAFSRELARTGAGVRMQHAEIRKIKTWTSDRVEYFLQESFGKLALQPRGDLDRPFAPAELRDFARSKWVHVGNHSANHAILTNCTRQEIERQVRSCQQALAQIVGEAPIAIAYPNGNYSRAAIQASLDAGLRVGFTTLPRRNLLPLDTAMSRMTLGRFLFTGGEDPHRQCRKFSSRFIPSNVLKTLRNPAH